MTKYTEVAVINANYRITITMNEVFLYMSFL
jgi:hypothetical protein